MTDDDKTVFRAPRPASDALDDDRTVLFRPDALDVVVQDVDGEVICTHTFSGSFTVGRALDNSIVINNDAVSRKHLEFRLVNREWWVCNLKSTNGLFIDGQSVVDKDKLHPPCLIALGLSGIYLKVEKAGRGPALPEVIASVPVDFVADETVSDSSRTQRSLSEDQVKARLLSDHDTADMGDYTLMVRRVIRDDRVVRRKSYRKIIWILAGLFCLSVGLVTYQQIALSNTRKLAIDMFYDIKTLEVNLSQADLRLEASGDALTRTLEAISNEKLRVAQEQLKLEQEKIAAEKRRMQQERQRLANMKAKYRDYVEQANGLRLRFPTAKQYEEDLIARVSRELGESELELPDGFVDQVRTYIGYWQNSSRLQVAIDNMEHNGYVPVVIGALQKHGLPIYFLYLPLQESNFDAKAIGPETRYGIAKGAWQLLAGTAQQYGVQSGPLAGLREYDEQDGRFDFQQATEAGVKYLAHIYGTEAQASGLLVMASYNYGDNRVRGMISKLEDNPRDRNFWKLLQAYELPKETKDYVFYIFSAAVIGEDPAHFGFKFNPPLFAYKAVN